MAKARLRRRCCSVNPKGTGTLLNRRLWRCTTLFQIPRCPGRGNSVISFPDFDGFQISGGTHGLTGAATIAFCRINTWKGFIGFFIPLDLNGLIGAGL